MDQVGGQQMIRMELKYCERCGGLLLRRTGEDVVYCSACEAQMRELPVSEAGARQGARRREMERAMEKIQEMPASQSDDTVELAAPPCIPPQRVTLPGGSMNTRRLA